MSLVATALDGLSFAGDPTPLTGRAVLVAVIVVGLMAAAAWALKRTGSLGRGRPSVSVETAVSLGERRSVVIVAVEGRRLLLGLAPGQVSLLTELARPDQSAFARTLDRSIAPGSQS